MNVTYTERGRGWKVRGRPQATVPPEVLETLRTTHLQGVQAEIPLYGTTDTEVRQFVRILTRGAQQLGLRLRHQSDGNTLRFYAEAKSD